MAGSEGVGELTEARVADPGRRHVLDGPVQQDVPGGGSGLRSDVPDGTTRACGFQDSIDIKAAPDDVWAVLADVERWPDWTGSIDHVELQGDGELTPGAKVRIKQPRFPSVTWEVTELESGRNFARTATNLGLTSVGDHRLAPVDAATVNVQLELGQSGPLAGVLGALTKGLTRRYLRMEAEGLKRRCKAGRTWTETGTGAGTGRT